MDYLKNLRKSTKIIFICALILLIYGYLARYLFINFFWESKTLGYAILFIGLIRLLTDDINIKKSKNKKTIWNKIGIVLIVFILVVQVIFIIVIPNTVAYERAKDYIKNNQEINNELGEIKGFGLIPNGSIQVMKDSNGEQGSASINMIIKGQKKYKEVTVFVNKYVDSEWKVEGIE